MTRSLRKPLRPAFVLTLAALAPVACKKAERTTGSATGPVVTVSGPYKPDEPPRALRKRTVRPNRPKAKESKLEIDWSQAERLNPKDARGAWIYTASDGTCFVGLPDEHETGDANPPGVEPRRPVDCPEAMLDPAWDTCFDAQLIRPVPGKDECLCDRHGNPPPPPTVAECPKSPKAAE